MTKIEVGKLIETLSCLYPTSRLPDMSMMVTAWHMALSKYDYKVAVRALGGEYLKARIFPSAIEVSQAINAVIAEDQTDPNGEYQKKLQREVEESRKLRWV